MWPIVSLSESCKWYRGGNGKDQGAIQDLMEVGKWTTSKGAIDAAGRVDCGIATI